MRRAAKKDRNHNEIAAALMKMGFSVADTSQLGEGFPDIVAGRAGINFLIEVKDYSLPPSHRKLTPEQVAFHNAWNGQICVIKCVEEIQAMISRPARHQFDETVRPR